jgi:hypothetical protein
VQHGRIQRTIALDRTLPRDVKAVYSVLAVYANAQRICWPSRETIALDASMSVSAVGRALRHAAKVGILTIIHTQTSNRYQLHDMNVGGYIPGEAPAGHTDLPGESGGPSGQVTQTHKQDHTTRPAIQTTSTSSDAVSGGHRTSSPTERKIYLPADFSEYDDRHANQFLVGAVVAAIEKAGLIIAPTAADSIGSTLKRRLGEGATRAQLVSDARAWLRLAGTKHGSGWIASYPESRAA